MRNKIKTLFIDLWNKIKIRLYTFAFFVGIIKETKIFSHDMSKPMLNVNSMKVVNSFKEVVEYGRDLAQPNRYVNGTKIKYHKTISAFSLKGDFFFIVLYKKAV